jgi:hypothetical protein
MRRKDNGRYARRYARNRQALTGVVSLHDALPAWPPRSEFNVHSWPCRPPWQRPARPSSVGGRTGANFAFPPKLCKDAAPRRNRLWPVFASTAAFNLALLDAALFLLPKSQAALSLPDPLRKTASNKKD